MKEFERTFVDNFVGRIYEAAVDPAHWSEIVTLLERVYPVSRVTLFGHHKGHPTANFSATANFVADDVRDYAGHYVYRSPYIARSAALPLGRAYHYEMLIREDELRRTEY